MVTLIISFYKNIPALDLILKSLQKQTYTNFEVIVAEDANDEITKEFLERERNKYFFPIHHVWHDDIAFWKTKINNDAIKIAKGEKLVFIDGDCILHKRFIETYNNCIVEGKYLYGRRVMLGPKISNKLLETKDIKHLQLFKVLFSDSKQRQEAIYFPLRKSKKSDNREIWGCNWGVLKKYMIGINGFDEDYMKIFFGEDLDVGWRLKAKYDLKLISLKNLAIQYHLYHKTSWNKAIEDEGRILFDIKRQKGLAVCENGIVKK